MKCDTCHFKVFHSPGSWYSVAEGYDDPYAYEYCAKEHWVGAIDQPQDESQVGMDDPWKDCADFKEVESPELKTE